MYIPVKNMLLTDVLVRQTTVCLIVVYLSMRKSNISASAIDLWHDCCDFFAVEDVGAGLPLGCDLLWA